MIDIIHWLQQIQAILGDRKPIIVVGTHADMFKKKEDCSAKMDELIELLKRNSDLLQSGVGILFINSNSNSNPSELWLC